MSRHGHPSRLNSISAAVETGKWQDVTQQLRAEMNEAISGRMDMMNSTALSKPYRISDLIPRNWEGSSEKGEFRSFMSDLHLWMQAWSHQGEQMLARVESVDRFDNNVIAVDCSDEEFRSIEAPLYQVLHRTTANEPLWIAAANERTESIQSMACNSEKVRSEEYVRQKFSVCSADQQHLREGQGEGCGAV